MQLKGITPTTILLAKEEIYIQ